MSVAAPRKRVKRTQNTDSDFEHLDDSGSGSDFTAKGSKRTAPKRKRSGKVLGARACAGSTHSGVLIPGSTQQATHPVSVHVIANAQPMQIALLDWYAGVHETRGMPWRKPYDPTLNRAGRSQRAYEVWISEIMLQQTQVATVIPYYSKWMKRYPTIRDLAASDIEIVNSLWKGLGYYSRAARLLTAAKKIVDEYDGTFPDNAKDMIANVPGIGRYSAGAIASIAYNHCEPVLDGNVTRLLCRVLALYASPKSKESLDILWAGALALVKQSDRPGDINQALIELGATVCKESPGRPPIEQDIEELCTLCEAPDGDSEVGVMRYPLKVEKKKAREETDIVCVAEWCSPDAKRWFLLVRRPEKGLLAGLHEFPTRANVDSSITLKSMRTTAQELLNEHLSVPLVSPKSSEDIHDSSEKQLHISKVQPAGDVLHIFSHIRKTYKVIWVLLEGGEKPPRLRESPPTFDTDTRPSKKPKLDAKKAKSSSMRWVLYEEVEDANIGTGVMKVWKKVNESRGLAKVFIVTS